MKKRIVFKESDFINKEFGYLTILGFIRHQKMPNGNINRFCIAKCKCGTKKEYTLGNIKSGLTQSCGCKPYKNANPYINTKVYRSWSALKDRCLNPNNPAYKDYGGRGIKVCNRWLNFYNFLEDMGNPPTKKHSIDRIDVNGNYKPSNCRWATQKQQMNNTRFSKELTIQNLSKKVKITNERIRQLYKENKLDGFVKTIRVTKKSVRPIFLDNIIPFINNKLYKFL